MNEVTLLPLSGRTVVITRALAQAEAFARELEQRGAKVIACPTIEIAPPDSYERLDEAIDHLYGYDWIIFTSVNGVDHFHQRLVTRSLNVGEVDELRVCAIGEATAQRLREVQIHADVVPAESKAEGIFSALVEFLGGAESLRGLNFLIPRAAIGRDYLPRALERAGARVDVVTAYQTRLPEDVDRARLGAMLAGSADCIAFTSASAVRNLAQLFDTHDLSTVLPGIAIACIGDVTAETAAEFGLKTDIQPQQFTIPALADAIANFYA